MAHSVAHSFAERPSFNCPQCGQPFSPDVWVVIDAAERPDLLARVRDGSIHVVICPRGHANPVYAPLLIFRPEEARALLFSPARGTTDEQNQEAADALLTRLVDSLGAAWREEWLEGSVAIPRAALAAVLAGADPEAATAPDTPPSYRADMERAKAATARYQAMTDLAALDEAAAAWERVLDNPDFAVASAQLQLAARNNAAIVFVRRYQTHGRLPDLDRALALWQAVLAALPPASPHQAAIGNNMGNGLRERYLRAGRDEDLDAAIAAWEFAVANTPDGAPEKAIYQNNLGNGLGDRYTRAGQVDDLERAVAMYRAAVAATPPDSVDYALHQNNLGNGLSDLYARTGRAADLDAAIAAYAAAIAATPPDSPERARNLNNLGAGLSDRYARTGRVADLDAAIAAYEAAVARTPPGSPDYALYQNSLGNGLGNRYIRTGRAEDLDAAIAMHQAAVAATPAGSPDYAVYQNNLGTGLSDRYERTRQAEDLDAAIAAYEAAVAATPANSPERARNLGNLGNGLRDRYRHTGQAADLDAAIAAHEAAVAGTPPGSPGLAARHNNLGVALRDRYALNKQGGDLEATIAACRAALAAAPPGYPERAAINNNLGNALRERYGQTGEARELAAAIAAYAAAATAAPAGSPDRASYFNNLGVGLSERYARTGQAADLAAAIAAYDDALSTLDRALVDSPVAFVLGQQTHWADLYARAADVLLLANRPADALAAAEGGKSRLLAGLVGRGDLPAPAAVPAALTAREQELAAQLNAFDAAELAGRGAVERSDRPGRAVADRAALVAALREVWSEMAGHGPAAVNYVAARRGDRPMAADLAALAAGLEPGAALLSLFVTPTGARLFLWPAGAAAPVVVEAMIGADELHYDYLAGYEEEVLNRTETRQLGRPLSHRWRALGRPLLGPLLPHLDGVTRLVIAPQSTYHQLPLHALWLDEAGTTLLDRCAVSYVPALGVLERLRRVVETEFLPRNSVSKTAVFGYTPSDDPRERALFRGEARRVAGRVGATARLDGEADGAALEAATAAPLRLLHLSCHGTFNERDALESGVLLADGVYSARRFLARRLPVELVTLSACRTGLSGSLGGDEMAGLSLALLSAGARSLLLLSLIHI